LYINESHGWRLPWRNSQKGENTMAAMGNINKKTSERIDRKVLFSSLWLFVMLTYTYGDVVTLMDPVKHGSIELTESFLLGGSIYMMIPITVVLLSRILKYQASRWASIIAGMIMAITLTLTLFVAVPTPITHFSRR